jgi:hypothetical protein
MLRDNRREVSIVVLAPNPRNRKTASTSQRAKNDALTPFASNANPPDNGMLPAVTFDVPQNQGTLLESSRGVIFAGIKINWWGSHINNLEQTADATHLALYLTDDVVLYIGQDISNCCVGGYHGLRGAGYGPGSSNSNGNAVV